MSTMQVNAAVTTESLLAAAESLSVEQLDDLVARMLKVRAQRRSAVLSHEESELLQAVNQSLSSDDLSRYRELIAKRDDESLSESEHKELRELTSVVERYDVERVEAIGKLADLRGTTLRELAADLGLEANVA